jgi:phasin family protein
MHASPNPFAELHQSGMKVLIEFAHSQFAAFERLSALNANVAKAVFEDSPVYSKALLLGGDTPELSRLSAELALPALDRSIVYSLGVCELGSQVHGEMARLVDAQASGLSKSIAAGLDRFAQFVPAGSGSGIAVNAVKSVLDTANAAFDSFTELSVRTSELAQTKFAAVTSGIADANATPGKTESRTSKTGKGTKISKGAKSKAI